TPHYNKVLAYLLFKQSCLNGRPERAFFQLQVVPLALIFLNFYCACRLHVRHLQEVKRVRFFSARWVITKAGGVSIACENAVPDRIMVVPLPDPAGSAAGYDIVMEFKVVCCVLCCPDTAIVSAIDQAISHS